jgi:hypothetical protein
VAREDRLVDIRYMTSCAARPGPHHCQSITTGAGYGAGAGTEAGAGDAAEAERGCTAGEESARDEIGVMIFAALKSP